MAMVKADYASSQSKTTLISGVTDKIILVTRICVASVSSGSVVFLSDPGGPTEADMTATLRVASDGVVELVLGRRYGLAAARSMGFGLTTAISGEPSDHGVMVWYELVD